MEILLDLSELLLTINKKIIIAVVHCLIQDHLDNLLPNRL